MSSSPYFLEPLLGLGHLKQKIWYSISPFTTKYLTLSLSSKIYLFQWQILQIFPLTLNHFWIRRHSCLTFGIWRLKVFFLLNIFWVKTNINRWSYLLLLNDPSYKFIFYLLFSPQEPTQMGKLKSAGIQNYQVRSRLLRKKQYN